MACVLKQAKLVSARVQNALLAAREHDKRISELEKAYERNRAEREGREYEEYDEDAAMWREFQKLFRAEWRWRAKVFYTGATLVILGFIGQLLGSWPYGVFGIKSC